MVPDLLDIIDRQPIVNRTSNHPQRRGLFEQRQCSVIAIRGLQACEEPACPLVRSSPGLEGRGRPEPPVRYAVSYLIVSRKYTEVNKRSKTGPKEASEQRGYCSVIHVAHPFRLDLWVRKDTPDAQARSY